MKKGWEYKKISEITFSIKDGDWIESKDQSSSGIRLIQTGNIGTGEYLDKLPRAKYISEDTFNRLHCTEIRGGDILISRLPDPVGRSCILPNMPTKCITAVDCSILKINPHIVVPKYFIYLTQSAKYFAQVKKQCTGTTRQRIARKKLESISLPIPPLFEQQRIVSYLDSAFAKINAVAKNAENSLNEAKALFQSALAKMMEPKEGWEEKTLSEIGMTLTGTTPSKSNSAFYGDYMPFIRPSEINYDGLGNLDYNSQIKLSKEGSEAGRVIKPGSILMVCIGATISKVGYSKQDVSCNQQINVIKPYDEYNYKFIYYAMTAPSFKAKVIKEGSSSQATLPIINKKKWEQLTIAYPSLDEQNLIADKLDRLNQKIHVLSSNLSLTLSECAALKQSILRQTFE